MTPGETIQAAIDKLSDQRDASQRLVPGRWSNTEDGQEVTGSHGAVAESRSEEHCDLIVTLHATIDAQTELLKLALDYGDLQVGRGSRFVSAAQHLAHAILDKETP